jgi:hypothetical protein
MSCRIDRLVAAQERVVLRISGRLVAEHVDTLRTSLEQEGRAVAIDLKDVLLVDLEAVKLLAVCELNGAELRNCPAYVREWVTRERTEAMAGRTDEGMEGREDPEGTG